MSKEEVSVEQLVAGFDQYGEIMATVAPVVARFRKALEKEGLSKSDAIRITEVWFSKFCDFHIFTKPQP